MPFHKKIKAALDPIRIQKKINKIIPQSPGQKLIRKAVFPLIERGRTSVRKKVGTMAARRY